MLATGYRHIPKYDWNANRVSLTNTLFIGVLGVAALSMAFALFKETSLSYATGIENKFASELPGLLKCSGQNIMKGTDLSIKAKLHDISKQVTGGMLRRDLVITASQLPMDDRHENKWNGSGSESSSLKARELPEDLYFYFRIDDRNLDKPYPPTGRNFVSLNNKENNDKLLDIVIGSGTIYPLFPFREVEDIHFENTRVDKIRIIDGGFIHNSPIDAAVKWGATHIILIQASPVEKPFPPHNFLDNSLIAFDYLFSQAQSIDAISRGSVEIFELHPTSSCEKLNRDHNCTNIYERDMNTCDFSQIMLRRAYDQGKQDVRSPQALFTRAPGMPLFRDIRPLLTK